MDDDDYVKDFCGCRKGIARCGKFLHNKEEDTYCKKTCSSWWRVISVYLTYLIIVLVIFVMTIYGLNQYVMYGELQGQIDKTTLLPHNTPQLTIFPRLEKSRLLWYSNKNNDSTLISSQYYVNHIDVFLKPYENLDPDIYVDCNDPTINRKGKFCKFTKDMLGPCGRDGYGYPENKPCIYLKLNKMRGWTPWQMISKDQDTNKQVDITGEEQEFREKKVGKFNQTMMVQCSGISTHGCDNLGKILLYPRHNFQSYYFPYNGSEKYLSPLVGVQLLDVVKGLVIVMTCSVWGVPKPGPVQKMLNSKVHIFIDDRH